jgi:hypothetical protein
MLVCCRRWMERNTSFGNRLTSPLNSRTVQIPSRKSRRKSQDPRYYQLGHGGFWRLSEHAVGRVLMTRSDSGQKQLNYSELGGALAAASISTFTYHPQSERGFGDVASVWGSQMGWDAVTYMIKEFWPDLRKHSKNHKQVQQVEGQASNNE